MAKLELHSERMLAWRNLLPEDLKAVVPADLGSVGDEAFEELTSDLATAAAKRIPEVIHRHGDLLAKGGRARRIRILAWAINRSWPDAARVISDIADDDDKGEGGGRGKVAPFFRADLEAMALVATSRIVRGAAAVRTVEAVSGGVRDFEQSFDLQRTGGVR